MQPLHGTQNSEAPGPGQHRDVAREHVLRANAKGAMGRSDPIRLLWLALSPQGVLPRLVPLLQTHGVSLFSMFCDV